jgi:hypothetical protein
MPCTAAGDGDEGAGGMPENRWQVGHPMAVAALVTGIAAVATGMAQSSTDKWWPGYGNGADNSRYFASQQISTSNAAKT